jgi:hypothetical protein
VVPFAFRKLARLVGVQRPQHSDPRMQQEVPAFSGADQAVNSGLPFGSWRKMLLASPTRKLGSASPADWIKLAENAEQRRPNWIGE